MRRRTVLRARLAVVVVASSVALLLGYQSTPPDAVDAAANQTALPMEEREQVVPASGHATVVTTDPPAGGSGTSAIVAYTADGRALYHNDTYGNYFDVDPERGLQSNRTLGAEDAYGILYEQHNADYIPADRGGPAVLVADSENNRVVEYQRTDGGWTQSWTWRDDKLRWPRDADRLPGGHTLVTDSQGDRVLEVDENGDVVWQLRVPTPYGAERLGTGDESATGRSRQANSTDGPADSPGETTGLAWLVAFVTGPLLNGLLYVAPAWMTIGDLLVALVLGTVGLVWALAEAYWRGVHRRVVGLVR